MGIMGRMGGKELCQFFILHSSFFIPHSSFFILISFFPAFEHSFVEFCFGRGVGLCVPETGIGGFVGQELLLYEVVGEIVCVFVAVVIAEFCHEFGWGVADGQGNR